MEPFIPQKPKPTVPVAPPAPPSNPFPTQKNEIFASIAMMEEKLNQVLKYQRRVAHMEMARTVMSAMIFIIFVILPIIGTYYLFEKYKGDIDFDNLAKQYQNVTSAINEFNSTSGQLKEIQNKVDSVDVGSLLKKTK